MMKYYDEIKKVYIKIFKRNGFGCFTYSGRRGVFTKNFTHEFQVIADSGEDEII